MSITFRTWFYRHGHSELSTKIIVLQDSSSGEKWGRHTDNLVLDPRFCLDLPSSAIFAPTHLSFVASTVYDRAHLSTEACRKQLVVELPNVPVVPHCLVQQAPLTTQRRATVIHQKSIYYVKHQVALEVALSSQSPKALSEILW